MLVVPAKEIPPQLPAEAGDDAIHQAYASLSLSAIVPHDSQGQITTGGNGHGHMPRIAVVPAETTDTPEDSEKFIVDEPDTPEDFGAPPSLVEVAAAEEIWAEDGGSPVTLPAVTRAQLDGKVPLYVPTETVPVPWSQDDPQKVQESWLHYTNERGMWVVGCKVAPSASEEGGRFQPLQRLEPLYAGREEPQWSPVGDANALGYVLKTNPLENPYWVVDIDNPAGVRVHHPRVFAALLRRETAIVRTLRGFHLYYRPPQAIPDGQKLKNRSGANWGDGLDIFVSRHLVLLPPSMHRKTGRWEYDWVVPLERAVPAPQWVIDLVTSPALPQRTGRGAAETGRSAAGKASSPAADEGGPPPPLTPWVRLLADRLVPVMARIWLLGGRHELALRFGGFCAHARLHRAHGVYLLDRILAAAGDEEPEDRRAALRKSYERHGDELAVTGWPRLREILANRGTPPATLDHLDRIVKRSREVESWEYIIEVKHEPPSVQTRRDTGEGEKGRTTSVFSASPIEIKRIIDPATGSEWWETEWLTPDGVREFGGTGEELLAALGDHLVEPRMGLQVIRRILNSLRLPESVRKIKSPGLYLIEGQPVVAGFDSSPPSREEVRGGFERLAALVDRFPAAQRGVLARMLLWAAVAPYSYVLKRARSAWVPDMVCVGTGATGKTTLGRIACALWGVLDSTGGASLNNLVRFSYTRSLDTRPIVCNEPGALGTAAMPPELADVWKQAVDSVNSRGRYRPGGRNAGGVWEHIPSLRPLLITTNRDLVADDGLLRRIVVLHLGLNDRIPETAWAGFDALFNSTLTRLETIGRAWTAHGWLADTARGAAYREIVLSARPEVWEEPGRECWLWLAEGFGCEDLLPGILDHDLAPAQAGPTGDPREALRARMRALILDASRIMRLSGPAPIDVPPADHLIREALSGGFVEWARLGPGNRVRFTAAAPAALHVPDIPNLPSLKAAIDGAELKRVKLSGRTVWAVDMPLDTLMVWLGAAAPSE